MCISPITLSKVSSRWSAPRSIQVPCGKCVECKQRYQNDWYIRLYEESKKYSHICHVTLTYNEDSCPFFCDTSSGVIYRTVLKEHVQNWLKRFRIRYQRSHGVNKSFKYFITSEYGPRTYRPHYHGIFFGLSKLDIAPLLDDWRDNFGFVKVSWINPFDDRHKQNSMRYVAKYCSKGEFECPYVERKLVNKTFHLISKKIGYDYIPKNISYHLSASCRKFSCGLRYEPGYLDEICKKRFYFFGSFRYSLPRYYKNKIYGEQSRLSHAIADYLLAQSDELYLQELEFIQSERLCTINEAINIYNNLYLSLKRERYKKAKQKYISFLNKSQL